MNERDEAMRLAQEAYQEMLNGRAKYPRPDHMLHAAICELFEMHKEILKQYMNGEDRKPRVRRELVQAMGTLFRLYLEGDPLVGLDPIRTEEQMGKQA